MNDDETNSQNNEQQEYDDLIEDSQQEKSQIQTHTLISQLKINQDKPIYNRTFFPQNTLFEKQNYVSLTDSQYNKINQNIIKRFDEMLNTTIDTKLKDNMLEYIQQRVSQISSKIQLCPYGGSQNGLSHSTGDIDATCLISQEELQRIELEWLQTCDQHNIFYKDQNIKLSDYTTSCIRFYQAIQQLQKLNDQQAIIDPEIIKDRQDCLLFDQRCVCQIITKSKVPLLRLNLFYNVSSQEIVDPEEFYKPLREQKTRPEHIKSLNVDLCVNNLLPLKNTQLISEYLKCCPSMRQLILILKKFCKVREISFSYDSDNINSYSLVLLVIQYLQAVKMVPNLQETPRKRYVCGYNVAYDDAQLALKYFTPNLQIKTLAELLTGFFYFYGYLFQYESQIISIRRGKILDQQEKTWKKQEQVCSQQVQIARIIQESQNEDLYDEIKNMQYIVNIEIPDCITQVPNNNFFMQIEDPFETNLNTTRNMSYKAVRRLKTEFRRGYAVIKKHKSDCLDALFLSPKIDPPGIIPEQDLTELKQLQKERDQNQGLEIIIDQSHSNVKLQFSQKPE